MDDVSDDISASIVRIAVVNAHDITCGFDFASVMNGGRCQLHASGLIRVWAGHCTMDGLVFGFNHFPRGLHLLVPLGPGFQMEAVRRSNECVLNKHMPQKMGGQEREEKFVHWMWLMSSMYQI